MKKLLAALLIPVIFSGFSAYAQEQAQQPAEPQLEQPKVRVKLISEFKTVEPGKPFWVALHQKMTPEWHTYWDNPGDSGLKTKIRWILPPGFTAEEIVWPTPVIEPMGPVINYGYSDEVVLPVKITPTPELKEGQIVRIAADASWLACKEVCIPEQIKDMPITLTVSKSSQEPSPDYQLFADIRAKTPIAVALDRSSTLEFPADAPDKARLTFASSAAPLKPEGIVQSVYFFPRTPGLINHAPAQDFYYEGDRLTIETGKGGGIAGDIESLRGVLTVTSDVDKIAYDVTLPNPYFTGTPTEPVKATVQNYTDTAPAIGFIGAIIFAFLGGLALNLMPCVFPILSMKALSLVGKSHKKDKNEAFTGGIFYTLGILISFAVLGIVLSVLHTGNAAVGWGAQMQSPVFVLLMIYVLFIIGLMLSGIITVGSSLMGIGQNLTARQGHSGDFFTGMLAVIVATPCTAPFMGAAVFYAMTQPAAVSLIVLEMLGLGLALPYLMLARYPHLLKFLPKPGAWMERFKQFLAFPMYGAALWLIWVLTQQAGERGLMQALFGCLAIVFGAWLWQNRDNAGKGGTWSIIKSLIAVVAVAAALWFLHAVEKKITPIMCDTLSENAPAVAGEPIKYSESKLNELIASDTPVFVNMTASWCMSCLYNEKTALSTDEVKQAMKDGEIVYMKGDWTNQDPEITKYLESFGRKGVPLYVYYPKDYEAGKNKPVILPQFLTPSIVTDAFKRSSNDPNCSIFAEGNTKPC